MNILISLYDDNATGGGAEGILKQIAEEYQKRDAEVYVLFLKPRMNGHWDSMGYSNIHLYYGGGLASLNNIFKLRGITFDYS